MRNELVHRLTHVGHRHLPATRPDRGHLGRVGELARTALRALVVAAGLTTVPLAAALFAAALATGAAGLPARPVAGWLGVVVATAATPALVRRLAIVGGFRR